MMQYPDLFAAGVPISSASSVPPIVEALKDDPLWFFHGVLDDIVDYNSSVDAVNALKAAGGNPRLTLFENLGHGGAPRLAYQDSYAELYPWLFSQSLPVPEPSTCSLAILSTAFFSLTRRKKARQMEIEN